MIIGQRISLMKCTERGMCWPHVLREVKGKFKGVEKNLADEIVNDISSIQLSQTRFEFDEANMMFYMKWFSLSIKSMEDFIEYYHKQWVASTKIIYV